MKKLLLGLGAVVAVAAPLSMVACTGSVSAKYVSTQEEGRALFSNILDDALSASADTTYNAFLSKDFGDHPGFTFNVRFSNESGSSLSAKNNMYEYLAHKLWDELKENFLNPFQVEFKSTDNFMSKELFGYAHGCEDMWTNNPTHQDGALYER